MTIKNINAPTYDDVFAASERIRELVVHTPLLSNPQLDELTGASVFIKPECLQTTGSFKLRGASNAIANLDPADRVKGVTACSSGNHAQGIAVAARRAGIDATIVMPADAPAIKIARTKRSGATVITYDRLTEDRDEIAQKVSDETGAALIHPYNHRDVIAGQGTCGIEVANDLEAMNIKADRIIVCCGGGGLSAGVALAMKQHNANVLIHTAEPVDFDDYARSLSSGNRQTNKTMGGSICDAIVTPSPGEISFEIGRRHFSDGIVVDEGAVRNAMRFAYNELKLVVEPGGAVALAALLESGRSFAGETVVIVLSGGNADPQLFAQIIAAS